MEEKTETIVKTDVETRRDEYLALKAENDNVESELLRREKLKGEMSLGGTTGGHVDAPVVSEEDKQVSEAADFFKGTQLEDDIRKANA